MRLNGAFGQKTAGISSMSTSGVLSLRVSVSGHECSFHRRRNEACCVMGKLEGGKFRTGQ